MADPITAWSFNTKPPGSASWGGNLGYADELGSHYAWDSGVANHRQVAVGHLALFRNAGTLLGFGWIEEIAHEEGTKLRQRCPVCGRTKIEARTSMLPRFRCYNTNCRAEFDEPAQVEEPVTRYVGYYGTTWTPLIAQRSAAVLDEAYRSNDQQNAIRGLSYDRIRKLIEEHGFGAHGWTKTAPGVYKIEGGHRTGEGRLRLGQGSFRSALLKRFGPVCAVSGEHPYEVLEAAHLYSYAESGHHDVEGGGLLLRRDIHALFDRFLLGIDTDVWRVRLGASIRHSPAYRDYDGAELKIPAALRPEPAYLKDQLIRVLSGEAETGR